MFLSLLAIYGISALILLYVLHKSVSEMDIHPPFSASVWYMFIVLTPVANTSVVLLLAGWKLQDWVKRRKSS